MNEDQSYINRWWRSRPSCWSDSFDVGTDMYEIHSFLLFGTFEGRCTARWDAFFRTPMTESRRWTFMTRFVLFTGTEILLDDLNETKLENTDPGFEESLTWLLVRTSSWAFFNVGFSWISLRSTMIVDGNFCWCIDLVFEAWNCIDFKHCQGDLTLKNSLTVYTVPRSSPNTTTVSSSWKPISSDVKFTVSCNSINGCACSIDRWPPIGYWKKPSSFSGQESKLMSSRL